MRHLPRATARHLRQTCVTLKPNNEVLSGEKRHILLIRILSSGKALKLPTEATPIEQFAYVPVNSTSIQLGLYVTGAGWSRVSPGSTYPQKGHPELYDFTWRSGRVLPEFQFVFISDGAGEFETAETGLQDIQAGTMLILQPDTWHRYRPIRERGWTEFWISVNGDLMYDWQNRGLLKTAEPMIRPKQPGTLISQYQAITAELSKHPRYLPTSVAANALMIMAGVIDQHTPIVGRYGQSEAEFSPMVNSAIDEIWTHSHGQISVAAIARKLNVVRRTLERAFRKETGHSIHTEIVTCRLDRAKRLLGETNVSIKAAAFAAGFSSAANMSKVFRRELNLSPGEYREELRKSPSVLARRGVAES